MAEFEVTLSAVQDAVSNIKTYTEAFKDEAEQVYQAAQTLSESWTGDASADFVSNMEQLHQWMNEMVEVLNTYSQALSTAGTEYEDADVKGASYFKK